MLLPHIAYLIVSQSVLPTNWWDMVQNHTLYQLINTDRNILIILSCWILSWVIGKMIVNSKMLKNYKEHWTYGLKLIVCSAAVWVPGLRPGLPEGQIELVVGTGISGEEIGYRIVLGIILSGVTIIFPLIISWAIGKYLPEKLSKNIKKVMF